MRNVTKALSIFLVTFGVGEVCAQDYEKGTGQSGCYFGEGDDCPGGTKEPVPPPPLLQRQWTDFCTIGNEIVRIDITGQTFGGPNGDTNNGFRRPPASPFCIFDIVATFTGAQMCVLNHVSGAVYVGGPPQSGGQFIGYCRPCNGGC